MAQETIPKYEYFVIYVHGRDLDLQGTFEQFNAKIESMVVKGWQVEGEHQVTYLERYTENLLLSQKMKRYSKAYERYQGYSDVRYLVTQ